ncbi:hypothetical protein [Actinomadura sp. 21ATH]|uniref:hypothetical protein n=1 Tax=Actinomadura sp. 21ATH TaxID=1735444 RepID=UPI0035BF9A92
MTSWLPEEDEFQKLASSILGREPRKGLPTAEEFGELRFAAALSQDDESLRRQKSEVDFALRWLAALDYEQTPLRLLAEQVTEGELSVSEVQDFAHLEFRLTLVAFLLWKGFDKWAAEEIAQESILWLHTGRTPSDEAIALVRAEGPPAAVRDIATPISQKSLLIGLERFRDRQTIDMLISEPEFKDGCRVLASRLWSSPQGPPGEALRADALVSAAGKVARHLHVVLRPRLEEEALDQGLSARAARRLAQETILHLIGDVETVGFG